MLALLHKKIIGFELLLTFLGAQVATRQVFAIRRAEFSREPFQQVLNWLIGFQRRVFRRSSSGKQADGHDGATHRSAHAACS